MFATGSFLGMTEIASPSQLRAALARWALVTVPGINLLGFISARFSFSGESNPWFSSLIKPDIYPPAIAFPIVWTVLYVLMGVSLAMVITARGARARGLAVGLFGLHLLANLAWSPLFFGAHQMTWALADIAVMALSLLLVMVVFARVRPWAAWLLVPYMAWVLFASVLNWQFLTLNPAADGVAGDVAVVRVQL
jgi:benzodiazapine receptor